MIKDMKAEINKQMIANHCTEAEAIDLIKYDQDVNRGTTDLYAPTKEEKKLVKSLLKSNTPREKIVRKPREKKVNPVKKEIISVINEALSAKFENVSIENDERVVNFTVNDEKFSVTLTQHREKKS